MDTNRLLGQLDDVDAETLGWSLAGGALALYGLSRRSLGGAALALLGAGFVYRGINGRFLAPATDDSDEMKVDESIDESFPASDPPAWTANTSVGR